VSINTPTLIPQQFPRSPPKSISSQKLKRRYPRHSLYTLHSSNNNDNVNHNHATMVTTTRPPTVDFSDESDPDEREQVFPDKTKMARLKRRSRADQDQDQDQDEQPISTIPTMMTARPVTNKKRKVTSGSGITPEEREKMARTSERLKKDAQRLPVNEGEPESPVFVTSLTPGPVSIWGTRLGHWIRIPGRIYNHADTCPFDIYTFLYPISLSISF
jgi:hypothetical protein